VGSDDFGFLPKFGKVALVAGYEIVRAGGIGAFEEDVVGGVGGDLQRLRGGDEMGAVLKELKELKPESSTYAEFRAPQDGPVFRKNRGRHAETSRLGDGEQQHGTLQTIRLKRRGNHDIGVEDEPKRKHSLLILELLFPGLALSGFRFPGTRLLNDAVNLP